MAEIKKGSTVKIHPLHIDRVAKFGFSKDKEYKVISTNRFWCSAKMMNDLGKEYSLDFERLVLIEEKIETP